MTTNSGEKYRSFLDIIKEGFHLKCLYWILLSQNTPLGKLYRYYLLYFRETKYTDNNFNLILSNPFFSKK